MIQKRYEFLSSKGKEFTEWFNYCEDDSMLKVFQKEEKWQISQKLRNEFRIKPKES